MHYCLWPPPVLVATEVVLYNLDKVAKLANIYCVVTHMDKAYKMALTYFRAWKIIKQICAKNAQNCTKQAKNSKNSQKMQKKIFKCMQNPNICTVVSPFFHICVVHIYNIISFKNTTDTTHKDYLCSIWSSFCYVFLNSFTYLAHTIYCCNDIKSC